MRTPVHLWFNHNQIHELYIDNSSNSITVLIFRTLSKMLMTTDKDSNNLTSSSSIIHIWKKKVQLMKTQTQYYRPPNFYPSICVNPSLITRYLSFKKSRTKEWANKKIGGLSACSRKIRSSIILSSGLTWMLSFPQVV